jgi:hypothetical protein
MSPPKPPYASTPVRPDEEGPSCTLCGTGPDDCTPYACDGCGRPVCRGCAAASQDVLLCHACIEGWQP